MKKFFKKNIIILIAAALVIALVTAVTVSVSSDNTNGTSKVANFIMRPVKSAAASMVSSLEHIYGYMFEYYSIVAENEELKRQVAELQEEYREYTEVSEENERLRKLLDLGEKNSDYKFEAASIISWTASNWESSFTINKGSNSGLSINDCIITETGYLVGQITQLDTTTATVTTVIDTSVNIGALVYNTGEAAVVQGDYALMKKGLTKLTYIPDGTETVSGDSIVTSGMGGIFPRGLVIGYVKEVVLSSSGLADYASIEPAAELDNLAHVYIITQFEENE